MLVMSSERSGCYTSLVVLYDIVTREFLLCPQSSAGSSPESGNMVEKQAAVWMSPQ